MAFLASCRWHRSGNKVDHQARRHRAAEIVHFVVRLQDFLNARVRLAQVLHKSTIDPTG